eukprot:5553335-Prymnesium_polylepis.2
MQSPAESGGSGGDAGGAGGVNGGTGDRGGGTGGLYSEGGAFGEDWTRSSCLAERLRPEARWDSPRSCRRMPSCLCAAMRERRPPPLSRGVAPSSACCDLEGVLWDRTIDASLQHYRGSGLRHSRQSCRAHREMMGSPKFLGTRSADLRHR